MATATWEEAIRCPRCDVPGRDNGGLKNVRSGVTTHSITCMNERCSWFETNWAVQVQADGTIPIREMPERQPKVFPKIAGMSPEKAAKIVRQIDDNPSS